MSSLPGDYGAANLRVSEAVPEFLREWTLRTENGRTPGRNAVPPHWSLRGGSIVLDTWEARIFFWHRILYS